MAIVTYSWASTVSSFFMNDVETSGVQDSVSITAINGGASYFSAWDWQDTFVDARIIGNDGTPAGSQFQVNTTTAGLQNDSSTAQLTGGNIIVTFTDYSVDPGGDIRARLFDSTGAAIDLDFGIHTSTSDTADSDVAALADGGFVVTWTRDYNGLGDLDIHAAVFNSDGTARNSLFFVDNLFVDNEADSASRSQVIGLANGNFVVVWEKEPAAGGSTEVYYRIYDSLGLTVTDATLLDGLGTINEDIQISALHDGGFAVAYADNGWFTGTTEITVRMFNADGSARTNFLRANTDMTGDQDQPTLTVMSNGYLLVGWHHGSTLMYQAYDADGNAIGDNYAAISAVVEGEIAALEGGLVANVRSSTIQDAGGDQSICSSVDELTRTTTGDGTNETMVGDSLRDVMFGNDGNDVLLGGAWHDSLYGGFGNDRLDGGEGNDALDGGIGIDTASYAATSAGVAVSLALSGAQNTGGAGYDTLSSIENLTGSSFADTLSGNSAANVINGGAGADTMYGGLGNDTYIADSIYDRIGEAADGGTDLVQASVSYILASNVENLTLTGIASINATGNGLANILIGNSAGNVLNGQGGADTMSGGLGNDVYVADSIHDRVIEGADGGNDLVYASVSYALASNVEGLRLTGTANINATGNGLANSLTGNNGANVLNGQGGADYMYGGFGNDVYVADNIYDRIGEVDDGGTDLVYASVSYMLGTNIENLRLTGTADINGTGNGLANSLTGNSGANVLNGGGGADYMYGGFGNDVYVADNIYDRIGEVADGGTDLVYASVSYALGTNVESLRLTGTANINAIGNTLANSLTGNSGSNGLVGGDGSDYLTGGAGADRFVFNTSLDSSSNVDRISDFSVADDTIQLDQTIFSGIASTGTLAASAFHTGTAAQDADDRLIYDSATGRIYYDADGSGAGDQVLFAQVTAGLALTNADFLVVG